MDSADFSLYREGLGKYLFDGRPEVYFGTRLTRAERILLEFHEHSHWELANASVYGREQIALAEAIQLNRDRPVAAELARCLEASVDASCLVYEGNALAVERTVQTVAGEVTPDWNSLLRTKLYGQAYRLFDHWLRKLPYSPGVQTSIATNVAELCLNSVSILDGTRSDRDPISARDPQSLHAETLRAQLALRGPDLLLRALSKKLAAHTADFVRRLDAAATVVLGQYGLSPDALRADDGFASASAMTQGRFVYTLYETLRRFAEDHGAITGTREYGLVQDVFQLVYADWLRRLRTDLSGTPVARGIRVQPPSDAEVRQELDFFGTVYTVVRPPRSDPAAVIPAGSWARLHQAFQVTPPHQRRVYLGITAVRPPADTAKAKAQAWYELSASRAVLAQQPKSGFFWNFSSSRYRMLVPAERLRAAVVELLPYDPAIAVPVDLMDFATGGVRDLGTLPANATVGVLLENLPFARWREQIELLSHSFRTVSTYYSVGPAEIDFIVTFGIAEEAHWFLYLPLSVSMLRLIEEGAGSLTRIAGHRLAHTIDELPISAHVGSASFLICEQYVRNGL